MNFQSRPVQGEETPCEPHIGDSGELSHDLCKQQGMVTSVHEVVVGSIHSVDHIEEAFNRAEDTIGEKDLDALMTVYADTYRYQDITKADMRTIWKGFLNNMIGSLRSTRFLASW